MQNYILAGVGTSQMIDKSTGEIVANSKTLVDSGINFTVTAEDIRGGLANKLLGQYFHDSGMSFTLTDALFNLNYLALNVGSTISVGGDKMVTEQVVSEENSITVLDEPQNFLSLGTIGWYSIAGSDDWKKITFVGKKATVSGLAAGTNVCVKYKKTDETINSSTVSAALIPAQCYLLLTLPLFKSGTDVENYNTSSKVGEVQIEVPSFLLAGSQDLALTSSGAATTALSGNALATFTGNQNCDDEGYYANLKQVIFNKDEFDDVTSIAIANGNIELQQLETATLEVYAIYNGITAPKRIDNSKLTFSVTSGTSAQVGNDGKVTAQSSDGITTVEVVVKTVPELTTTCVVTVGEA